MQQSEKTLLLSFHYPEFPSSDDQAEFAALAEAAGVTVLEHLRGALRRIDPATYLGSGKVDEIKAIVTSLGIEVVLCDNTLTPGQTRNLEKIWGCKVLDRTELILDIFARRARTHEGKLQVELAQLEHLRSRLVRGWTHLERQKGGIGLRGPGETQLETDRRLLGVRIKNLKKRLEKVEAQRTQNRRARERANLPLVSLVGYTNAGKSTLFNQLTGEHIFAEDLLFATLDPTTRQIKLEALGEIVITDTVGFIRDLPHDLVAAFKATLEETRLADLLLHVIDVSHANWREQVLQVNEVLTEIGADHIPQLWVMNKIDQLSDVVPHVDNDDNGELARVWLSAMTGSGLELLKNAITERLNQRYVEKDVLLEPQEAKLRATLYQLNAVLAEHQQEDGKMSLHIKLSLRDYARLFGI